MRYVSRSCSRIVGSYSEAVLKLLWWKRGKSLHTASLSCLHFQSYPLLQPQLCWFLLSRIHLGPSGPQLHPGLISSSGNRALDSTWVVQPQLLFGFTLPWLYHCPSGFLIPLFHQHEPDVQSQSHRRAKSDCICLLFSSNTKT